MTRPLLALILFSAITSAVMSAIVCGVMTYKMSGLSAAFSVYGDPHCGADYSPHCLHRLQMPAGDAGSIRGSRGGSL